MLYPEEHIRVLDRRGDLEALEDFFLHLLVYEEESGADLIYEYLSRVLNKAGCPGCFQEETLWIKGKSGPDSHKVWLTGKILKQSKVIWPKRPKDQKDPRYQQVTNWSYAYCSYCGLSVIGPPGVGRKGKLCPPPVCSTLEKLHKQEVNAELGRRAANLSRILSSSDIGRNPLPLYIRGLKVWWPEGWKGWLLQGHFGDFWGESFCRRAGSWWNSFGQDSIVFGRTIGGWKIEGSGLVTCKDQGPCPELPRIPFCVCQDSESTGEKCCRCGK